MSLEPALRHPDGWPALSITDSPQTMELMVTNRGGSTLETVADGATELLLGFRPGVLRGIDAIVLSPDAEARWKLLVEGHTLRLVALASIELAPGASVEVRLEGVAAEPRGGSRATRVEFTARGLTNPDGLVADHVTLMPLNLLRRSDDGAPDLRAIRTGSYSAQGPFVAGLVGGDSVVNHGEVPTDLHLRLLNVSGAPVITSADDEAATRVVLSVPVGSTGSPWGMLGSVHDHVAVTFGRPGETRSTTHPHGHWRLDGHVLHRTTDQPWARSEALDLTLTVQTTAATGSAPIVISYENLIGHDDGDLVVLVHVGPTAASNDRVVVAEPLKLVGGRAQIELTDSHEPDAAPAATITASDEGGLTFSSRAFGFDADLSVAATTRTRDLVVEGSIRGRLSVRDNTSMHGWLQVWGTDDQDAYIYLQNTGAGALVLGSHEGHSTIESRGGELRLNPAGTAVAGRLEADEVRAGEMVARELTAGEVDVGGIRAASLQAVREVRAPVIHAVEGIDAGAVDAERVHTGMIRIGDWRIGVWRGELIAVTDEHVIDLSAAKVSRALVRRFSGIDIDVPG